MGPCSCAGTALAPAAVAAAESLSLIRGQWTALARAEDVAACVADSVESLQRALEAVIQVSALIQLRERIQVPRADADLILYPHQGPPFIGVDPCDPSCLAVFLHRETPRDLSVLSEEEINDAPRSVLYDLDHEDE